MSRRLWPRTRARRSTSARQDRSRETRRFATHAFVVAVIATTPVFLFGAMSVQVRAEFDFGPSLIGALVATFFVSGALMSPLMGRVVQRAGSTSGMRFACVTSAAVLAALALAPAIWVLFVAFALGGAGNAAAQPAVSLALTEVVPARRLGLAFGMKQASVPVASMIGGLSVPLVGLIVGWRWSFAIAAGAAACYVVVLRRLAPRAARVPSSARPIEHGSAMPHKRLLVLTLGGFLAAASATSIGAFLVDSGVAAGLTPGASGLLFAIASAAGLASRVGLGWYVDASPTRNRYVLLAALLTGGAVGYICMSAGGGALFVVGALLGYAAGWGWSGVLYYVVVTTNRGAPATATGIGQAGTSMGAGLGPVVFGLLAERWSYRVSWWFAAALALAAAAVILSLTPRGGALVSDAGRPRAVGG